MEALPLKKTQPETWLNASGFMHKTAAGHERWRAEVMCAADVVHGKQEDRLPDGDEIAISGLRLCSSTVAYSRDFSERGAIGADLNGSFLRNQF